MHPGQPTGIAVEHLTKYYGATLAVDDVSFTVRQGEVTALLGPNGSGKSTLIRMVTGYFSPTAGRVRVGAIDMTRDSLAGRRLIGYLPEQVSLYPDLSVRRTLRFAAEAKGLGGRARRAAVDDVIVRCGLTEVADRPAGTLSKGYRQRVGLAQALVADPKVLVLDEPTVGLDPVQAVDMRALLRTLTGRTVLLSTHLLAEASTLCSRVVILARGKLVAEDTPQELARRTEGMARVSVRVDGPPEAVAAVLAELPGVLRVERAGTDGQAGVAFVVLAPDPVPVQRQLGAAIVGRGWTLLEARTDLPTLEDLFVRLVRPAAGN
jgi:ABC-2 type transport system ATP-binding protein